MLCPRKTLAAHKQPAVHPSLRGGEVVMKLEEWHSSAKSLITSPFAGTYTELNAENTLNE